MAATQQQFHVATAGRGVIDVTDRVRAIVADAGIATGVAHVFVRHTSCSLLVSENADPAVRADLERWLARAVPDGDPLFEHDAEGPDDMPAHVRAVLTGASVGVPVAQGRLLLGTWQGIYLYEHRQRPHRRELVVTVLGD